MRLFFCAFLFVCSHLQAQAQQFPVPALKAHVNDNAGILSYSVESKLNQILDQVKTESGIEAVVLTVDTLNGVPIEQASIQVTDAWKLGTAKGDKGLLLLLAVKDRRVRIEVGQGLEGELTDAESKRIIDQAIVPLMRSNNPDNAIFLGTFQMIQTADPSRDYTELFEGVVQHRSSGKPASSGEVIVFIIFVIFVLLFSRKGIFRGLGRRRGWYDSGGFGGGGFGGFGGGGGGLGGGGGFSGGGASGSW